MFIVKSNKQIGIKNYQLSIKDKLDILLRNYDLGMFVETLKLTKFVSIDEFATRLVYFHDKNHSNEQDFVFTANLEPALENELRKYLIKHKKFIFDYTISQEQFINSHIYQLYLQYIPYELTMIEKSVFLDAYINMVTDLRGNVISEEKRKKLEKSLHINQ